MKFAIIGTKGYIAPRHIEAITAVQGELVVTYDSVDSDQTMKDFVERCQGQHIDYLVVCTPNYLHKKHCAIGLAIGANVICEKPVALCKTDVEELARLEHITGKRVYNIMQLRYLFQDIEYKTYNKIKINYHLPRDDAYFETWKGQQYKSGGIITNIGIHIFDLCLLFCGNTIIEPVIFYQDSKEIIGKLYLERGEVEFTLSVKPGEANRLFEINEIKHEFTNYNGDLHIKSYKEILEGKGFTLNDALPSVELCENLTKSSL